MYGNRLKKLLGFFWWKVSAIVVGVAVVGLAHSQLALMSDSINDVQGFGLSGRVRSVIEEVNSYGSWRIKSRIEFNEEGFVQKHIIFGINYGYTASFFDDEGKRIRREHYDKYGTLTEVYVDTYENGRRVRTDGNLYHIYSYDENGNLIQNAMYRGDLFVTIADYEYDAQSNVINLRYSAPCGVDCEDPTVYYYDYKYDDNGNILEYKFRRGSLVKGEMFKYDERGNLLASGNFLDFPDELFRPDFSYKYDDQNNVIEKSAYYYDSETGVLEHEAVTSLTYEFDEHGNWIKDAP